MQFPTGYYGVNKQGLEFVVLDASLSKKTKIKFLMDNAEVVTTQAYLKNGLPCHPTFGKLLKGQIYKDRKGHDFELCEKVGEALWKIKYLKDGVECTRENKAIKSGRVKHPHDGIPKVGEKYKVNAGFVEVIEYLSATNVIVKFEDGSTVKTSSADLRKGNVGHPSSGLSLGQKFETNSGWTGVIVDYKSCYEVGVKWQDGSIEYHPASHIKNGSIYPCNQPLLAGVGYFGIGRFSNKRKLGGEKAPQVVYDYWTRMILRCYNPDEISKRNGKWYIYTEICKEWFCFQNFAEWTLSQPNWNFKFELDKDLLGTGFEYSPEYCTFLPADVNVFLAEVKFKPVHDLPIGVQYIKPGSSGAKIGYVARCHTEKGREYLGYYDDPIEAFYSYKKAKENYAKVLAEKYKHSLTPSAYDKLSKYEITEMYAPQLSSCVDNLRKLKDIEVL